MERLTRGDVIIGDGGMTYALELRGFVTATNWTPEAVVEHPEAGMKCICARANPFGTGDKPSKSGNG